MTPRSARNSLILRLALMLASLTLLLAGCGTGGGILGSTNVPGGTGLVATAGGSANGTLKVELIFPPAKTASAAQVDFPATTSVLVHVIDRATHRDAVPPVRSDRPLGAQTMSILVPDLQPGTYDVFVQCFDAQGGSAGYALPEATVVASQTVTVQITGTVTLNALTVAPATSNVEPGGTQQFTATATFSDNSTKDVTYLVTWTSNATGFATIVATTGLATGVTAGTATITATLGASSGSAQLVVAPPGPTLLRVEITPSPVNVMRRENQQLTATAVYSDGTQVDVTNQAVWSSGTPATATIDAATGLATTVTPGSTDITATFAGQTGTAQLNCLTTLFVCSFNDKQIFKVAADGSQKRVFADLSGGFGRCMAYDSNGDMWVPDEALNRLLKVSATDGAVTEVVAASQGMNFPCGVGIDASDNKYVSCYNQTTVWKVTPAGALSAFATLPQTESLGLTAKADGRLYVSDRYNIMEVPPSGGVVTTVYATRQVGLSYRWGGLRLHPTTGNLWGFDDGYVNLLYKDIPGGGAAVTNPYKNVDDGMKQPMGMDFDVNDDLYVTNTNYSQAPGSVMRVAADGTTTSLPLGIDVPGGVLVVR